ncbi:solute carrier family 22 member 4-like isoform X2 [Gouania willdenowi]|uniref:solute carrier family 22 member 4-like isoform X2 n=1 Tax=Gouania willdenowi TaxID=441366 RepID=UPI00105565B8|nr:solute carrier family 22 member 4-like isoform X2 [Gouania willdenowi]
MTDYESSTAFLGEWGRFQQTVFFLLCLTSVSNGFAIIAVIFLTATPQHHCLVPADLNLTAAWTNHSIPLEEDDTRGGVLVPSQCFRYKLEDIRSFSERGLLPGVDVNLSSVATEGCLDGWVYDQSVSHSTITTEWNLVCDESWKTPLTSSIFFLGVFTGSFFSGQLSDRYGRKIVLFACLGIQAVFTLIQLFSSSWTMFCIIHFVVGIGQVSNFVAAFVLGTEILSPRVRTVFSTLGMSVFFGFGYMMLPVAAYFIRDWRMLLVGLALPCLLLMPLWWFIPESPRWLLSQGRVEEAVAIVKAAAKMNNIEPPQVIFSPLLKELQVQKKTPHNFCDLLRTRNIRWISITLWLVWLVPAVTVDPIIQYSDPADTHEYSCHCLLCSFTQRNKPPWKRILELFPFGFGGDTGLCVIMGYVSLVVKASQSLFNFHRGRIVFADCTDFTHKLGVFGHNT